ncbi:putative manganese-dependent inorganic diphosphatase [Eubacteriales bacterium OttesenSCG-928-N13]|nr:putative manganese-dependent inorganic diphosphatase [Eubacteriales bacterium OttesenSCG-928-N13]
MEPIYVIGHRNPDTDSVVSAMAYAALRNALGDREFVAARLGQLNDETQMVLDRFNMEPPLLLHNVRTQVRDLQFDTPPVLNAGVTVNRAWSVLHDDTKILALPITQEDGTLFGMLTRGDIATFDMYSIEHPVADNIPMFNLLSSLEARILNDSSNIFDSISGEVIIALPRHQDSQIPLHKDTIMICGHQPELIDRALEVGVSCVILCGSALTERYSGTDSATCILSTPCDPYRAARMIYQSIPVSRVCQNGELVHFHLNDYIDDVREQMLQSRYRSYPIVDEQRLVAGTLSRYHLIRPKRKRVVLVDHNETSQSVSGIDQAEIIEIIDHHRLADVQTGSPIYFRNEPVGSTATIVATIYQEKGLMPPPNLAGLMAAAIVSDTVMFKSPTCTERDTRMAERMARIADVSLDELGYSIFSASSSEEKPARELIFSDFKEFHIAGHMIGIGQITCLDSDRVLGRIDEFLPIMRESMQKKEYNMILLMITDVLKEGSELVYLGDDDVIRQAFNVDVRDNHVFLQGIVSRKKQVVPMLSLLWG